MYQVAIGKYSRGDTRTRVTTSVVNLHKSLHAALLYPGEPSGRVSWARVTLRGEAARREVDWNPNYRPANQHGRTPTPLAQAVTAMALSDTLPHLVLAVN
jgi:hypothetical protein